MHRDMHRERKNKKTKKTKNKKKTKKTKHPCSSVVERPPFKRVVIGSIPIKDNAVLKVRRVKRGARL